MSKPKFTPGPWVYEQEGTEWYIHDSRAHSGDDSKIAMVYMEKESPVSGDIDDGENRANAHLIAAAPDLYEALEALVNAHELIALLSAPLLNTEPAMRALAKARGEQS